MVPKGWRLVALENISESTSPIRYGVVQIGEDTVDGIPIVPIKYINAITTSRLHRASKETEGKYTNSRVQGGDVLISVKGTIGAVGVVPDGFFGNIAREIARIRPSCGYDSTYIALQLQAEKTQREIESLTVGTTRREFSIHALRKFSILVPPHPEQKKIAQILSTWDQAISTTEQLLANSQQQKKALMQQLLTGKKRLLDKNGVKFSGEWKAQRIGSLLKEVKRPVQWSDDDEYRLLSVKRRSEGVVLREVLKGSDILTKKMNVALFGDFLISKMQVVHGASGLVSREFNGFHISDSYISLIPKDSDIIDINYFSWLSKQKSMYYKAFLCSYGVHIEKMTFNFNMYLKEKIVIPTMLEEQQKIASVLSAADQEIATLQRKLDCLKQEKKALMQQLLTGKRRVKTN